MSVTSSCRPAVCVALPERGGCDDSVSCRPAVCVALPERGGCDDGVSCRRAVCVALPERGGCDDGVRQPVPGSRNRLLPPVRHIAFLHRYRKSSGTGTVTALVCPNGATDAHVCYVVMVMPIIIA